MDSLHKLHLAIRNNDVRDVEKQLSLHQQQQQQQTGSVNGKAGVDLNEPDWNNNGKVPLLEAVARRNVAMVRLLLERGSDVGARNLRGQNSLHLALEAERRQQRGERFDATLVRELLDAGCDANVQEHLTGYTPLHVVVRHLSRASRNDAREEERRGADDVLQLLLASGSGSARCDVNRRTHRLSTALHFAACSSDLGVLQLLLDSGADMNAQNYRGETPLMEAIDRGQEETASWLIRAGCDVTLGNRYRQTALHYAANKNSAAVVVVLLVSSGECDVNAVDLNGDSALHIACGKGHVDAARILLSNGTVDPSLLNVNGKTAASVALESGFADVVQLTEQRKTLVNLPSPPTVLKHHLKQQPPPINVVYRHPVKMEMKSLTATVSTYQQQGQTTTNEV